MPFRAERLKVSRRSRTGVTREEEAAAEDSLDSPLLRAGNRAVAGLLAPPAPAIQRYVGWRGKDVVTAGYGWNVDERAVGGIRRIPLEGLAEGIQTKKAKRWVWDDRKAGKGHYEDESTEVSLSTEKAQGRAIVLVPDALDATKPIEVVVFLHGYTEDTGRPFAGWRALSKPPPAKPKSKVEQLRQGMDSKDVAPVRDVALDEAAHQLEASGQKQTVIVLPQGGLHSQFGKAGTANFNAGKYVPEIVTRLHREGVWKNAQKQPVDEEPGVRRVTMAGHSGAGATLAGMVSGASGSSAVTGDLVLYDAINGPGELAAFKAWARKRLDEALLVIKDPSITTEATLTYLRGAQKLRGYFTAGYANAYVKLEDDIRDWFAAHAAELGSWAPCLRANFSLTPVGLHHEELMRGVVAGVARGPAGNILDALRGLKLPVWKTTAACPAIPPPLPGSKYAPKPVQKPKARARVKAGR